GRLRLLLRARPFPQPQIQPPWSWREEKVRADALVDAGGWITALVEDCCDVPDVLAGPRVWSRRHLGREGTKVLRMSLWALAPQTFSPGFFARQCLEAGYRDVAVGAVDLHGVATAPHELARDERAP